jgi:hypothetical protein
METEDKILLFKTTIMKHNYGFHDLVYSPDEANFIKIYLNIHATNFQSNEAKVDKIIEIATDKKLDIFGLCEVNLNTYKLLYQKIKDTHYNIYPETAQTDEKDIITVCLYTNEFQMHDKIFVSDRCLSLMFMPRF